MLPIMITCVGVRGRGEERGTVEGSGVRTGRVGETVKIILTHPKTVWQQVASLKM